MKKLKWYHRLLSAAFLSLIISAIYSAFWFYTDEKPISMIHLVLYFGVQTLAFFALSFATDRGRTITDSQQ